MPMPTEERVSQLVAALVEGRGFDLEGVAVSAAGRDQARVVITVDSEAAADLDAVADLSGIISEILDDAGDFGETPYLLEVTTPGIERPLTLPRHWRRARGRKVRITMRAGAEAPEGVPKFDARVGEATDTEVALVLGGKRNPHRVHVPLADIERAVVQVEFSAPGEAEMELAGGVAPGRPQPGASGPEAAACVTTQGPADGQSTQPGAPVQDVQGENTSGASTEGTVA